MAGAKSCLLCIGATSWNGQFGCLSSNGTKSRINAGGLGEVGLNRLNRERFLHLRWRGPRSLGLQCKVSGNAFGLKKYANSRVATADIQLQTCLPAHRSWLFRSSDLQILCEQGQLERAMDILLLMDQDGATPTVNMYRSLLKACTRRKALAHAKQVHAHLVTHGFESTRLLCEDVVSTLVKCGGLEDALQIFHRLPYRTVFLWTTIISGCTNAGQGQEALNMFRCMQEEGLEPNKYTFSSLLKACGSISDLQEAKRMHAETSKYGCGSEVFVRTCLVDMYAKCGSIVDAKDVFDKLSERDVVLWTAMLAAYAHQGLAAEALRLYRKMQKEGVSPNDRTFVSVLQVCSVLAEKEDDAVVDGRSIKVKSLEVVSSIHADVRRKGYESDVFVCNTLITMYGKCGSIVEAEIVFDGLSHRNVVSWTAMIAAYVQQDLADKALKLYEQMCEESVSPNIRTFASVLQACCMLAEKEDHTLVDGRMTKVQSLHKERLCHGLRCLLHTSRRRKLEQLFSCTNKCERTEAIHAEALRKGWGSDVFVGNTLIRFYAKYGTLEDAQNVFNGLSKRDVVSWTAMMSAYTRQGQAENALALCEQMSEERLSPDDWMIVGMLQACGMLAEKEEPAVLDRCLFKLRCLAKVKTIHAYACRKGYQSNAFICSTLITMYGRCGSIVDARDVFDMSCQKSVLVGSAMLAAYVEQGNAQKAVELYMKMHEEGRSPNDRTFVSTLQACGMLAEVDVVADGWPFRGKPLGIGKMVHGDAWMKEGGNFDVFIGSALISMYGKCDSILDAQIVFDGLCQRDVVAWTAMLSAYVEQGQAQEALQVYGQMQEEGVSPNGRTFVSALQACCLLADKERAISVHGQPTKVKALEKGKAIHVSTWMKGYNSDFFVVSTLISMYAKCVSIVDAEHVFSVSVRNDVVLWNTMLTAYAQHGQPDKVLCLYAQMHEEGTSPDDRTFVSTLQACSMLAEKEEDVLVDGQYLKLKSLEKGKALHAAARRQGWASGAFVGNTVVAMYGRCGGTLDAQIVFDGLLEHDVVSWNAMLAACAQEGQPEKALELYEQMQEEGVGPDEITFLCIIQACSSTGCLDVCRQIHRTLVSTRNTVSPLLTNILIHAYGRCASMADAQSVFDTLPQPSLVSWNALVAGYARQGNHVASLQCYEKMRVAGFEPSGVTFLSLLSACNHAGLVDQGLEYFVSMSRDHGITPQSEHYVTMVDLLGRAGHFTKVDELISTMPMQPDLATWLCLLGACRKNGKVMLGKQAFDSAVRVQPNHGAAYLLMSNIYADAGLWDHAKEVKELGPLAGAWKKPGQTWIEHEQEVHSFSVQDRKHPKQEQLYALLGMVSSEEGRITHSERFVSLAGNLCDKKAIYSYQPCSNKNVVSV